jgi:hypothetical protein
MDASSEYSFEQESFLKNDIEDISHASRRGSSAEKWLNAISPRTKLLLHLLLISIYSSIYIVIIHGSLDSVVHPNNGESNAKYIGSFVLTTEKLSRG